MSGMLSQNEIDEGRAWSSGKTGADIAAAAQQKGYSAAQVAQVLGLSESAVSGAGYGSAAGLNSADASAAWVGPPASASATVGAVTASPYQNPAAYAPPPASTSATGYGTSAMQMGSDALKAGWQNLVKTAPNAEKAVYDYAKSQGWNAAETTAALNSASGSNYTVDHVNQYTQQNFGGLLGTGDKINDIASDISAAGIQSWGGDQSRIFSDVYQQVGRGGYGAGHAAEAYARANGIAYEDALNQVDAYGAQIGKSLLRADADWTSERGINDMRLINRDMHLNAMYADDAAAQYGASSGAELNRIFTSQGLPPLPFKTAPQRIASQGREFSPTLNRQIDADSETIEGRLNNLLLTDAQGNYKNPVVRQAVERAMQQMAGRGLLNSSMASQAGQEAAISKAIEITGPDAERYFQQGRANQDAQNVFARDEINFGYDMEKLDKQVGLQREQLLQSGSQFNQELAYKYDALNLGESNRVEAEARAHKYALEINEIAAVNNSYDLYLRRLTDIDNNKDYDAATKVAMKNAAGKDFDLYAKAKSIAWQMNLGERFSMSDVSPDAADLWQKLAGGNPNAGEYYGA